MGLRGGGAAVDVSGGRSTLGGKIQYDPDWSGLQGHSTDLVWFDLTPAEVARENIYWANSPKYRLAWRLISAVLGVFR